MSNFMDGYTRAPDMTRELSVALVASLRARPTQRAGQIICNAMGWNIDTLFNLHDEKLNEGLRAYLKTGSDEIAPATSADATLAKAIELVDHFDRYAQEDSGYHGSPFEANVTEFLQEQGLRA